MATTDITATEFLKQAAATAEHFGFTTIDTLKPKTNRDKEFKIDHSISAQDRKVDDLHGLLTAGVTYFTDNRLNTIEGPVLFYTIEKIPRSNDATLALHVYNVEKSIAEAILIHTTRSLAGELGFTNTSVRINSLGDKESLVRYNRELQNYLKKRLEDMSPEARELMKEHPFTALMHMVEKGEALGIKAPNPMEYLSDPSRKHFREVIEYLDMSEIPYEIDSKLLGHQDCYSDTQFRLDLLDANDEPCKDAPFTVRGGRCGTFAERHLKQSVNGTSAVVTLTNKKAPESFPKPAEPAHATVFVAQLGFGPKIKSLLLIDDLRRAGIKVQQNLASDSLTTQLLEATDKNAVYTIIIGQKEYVDGTVILRNMTGSSQESVAQNTVVTRLKKALLRKAK